MLVISHEDQAIMEVVAKLYYLKKDIETKNKYCDPRIYLSSCVGMF